MMKTVKLQVAKLMTGVQVAGLRSQVLRAEIEGSQVPGQHEKKDFSVVAMVKYLPDMYEALGSIPSKLRKLMKVGRIELRKMEMKKMWVGRMVMETRRMGIWRMDREMLGTGRRKMGRRMEDMEREMMGRMRVQRMGWRLGDWGWRLRGWTRCCWSPVTTLPSSEQVNPSL